MPPEGSAWPTSKQQQQEHQRSAAGVRRRAAAARRKLERVHRSVTKGVVLARLAQVLGLLLQDGVDLVGRMSSCKESPRIYLLSLHAFVVKIRVRITVVVEVNGVVRFSI